MHEPFALLFACGEPLPAGRCCVEYSREHDRRRHPALDASIDAAWTAAVARHPKTFDGSKFRLAGTDMAAGEGPRLRLGLTGYREYLGTNCLDAPHFAQLLRDGESSHGDAAAHLSNALGCEAVLITADNRIVLLRRSSAVATHSGLYNGPSGHPEPDRAGLTCGTPPQAGAASAEASRRAASELFDSVVAETVEETGIPRGSLSAPLLLGAMADSARKPDALFLLFTRLDSAAVRHIYESGAAAEGWESDRLALVPVAELLGADDMRTPARHPAPPGQRGHSLQWHAAAGIAGATTIDTGNENENEEAEVSRLPLTAVTRAAVECLRRVRRRAVERGGAVAAPAQSQSGGGHEGLSEDYWLDGLRAGADTWT